MNINCDVIGDLLPLYAEDLVSQASKDMVEDHLMVCESCTDKLAHMREIVPVPAEEKLEMQNEAKPLKKFRFGLCDCACTVYLRVGSSYKSLVCAYIGGRGGLRFVGNWRCCAAERRRGSYAVLRRLWNCMRRICNIVFPANEGIYGLRC